MTIVEFWRRTYKLPRAALLCAAIAIVLNIGSYIGLTIRSAGGSPMAVHALILVLAVVFMGRAALESVLTLRKPGLEVDGVPIPRSLVWLAVGALVYTIATVAHIAVVYGEGSAELRDGREVWVVGNAVVRTLPPGTVQAHAAASLRIFSAAWLFFALLIALRGHHVEQRIRAARGAGRRSPNAGSAV